MNDIGMKDIEERIQGWRRTLLAREGMLAEHADELEDHLREELARLRGGALSDEEAFVIAARRLGGSEAIATEFDRADSRAMWRRRWMWMLLGYLALNVAFRLILTAAMFALALARNGGPIVGGLAYSSVLLLGLAAVIAFARWTGRAEWLGRLPAPISGRLGAKPMIVGMSLLAIAILALVPWAGIWASSAAIQAIQSGNQMVWLGFMQYPQIALWLAPILALAILAWRNRDQQRKDDDLVASGDRV